MVAQPALSVHQRSNMIQSARVTSAAAAGEAIGFGGPHMLRKDRIQIFISHQSDDEAAVRRLCKDLMLAGVDVWVDFLKINVGDSFQKRISEGLKHSHFLGIWLTHKSVSSGWVEREWHSKFMDEINLNKIIVLPLLAEDCDVPQLLKTKHFADFRSDYNAGLASLLAAIRVERTLPTLGQTVAQYTKELLDELEEETIALPLQDPIPIIRSLKKLPRSGKKIRLETYHTRIPIRSVYDHILSVAHSADVLMPIINHGVPDSGLIDLARCIAYHELNEIILGDIPAYTNLSDPKRRTARIFAERRLKQIDKAERERITHEFISLFLDERERRSIQAAIKVISNPKHKVFRLFRLLDKIDPIVAVWRYLHVYRSQLDENAEEFLKRMKNFFEYPEVQEVTIDYTEDLKIHELVVVLQNRYYASEYYKNKDSIYNHLGMIGVPAESVVKLIEGQDLLGTPPTERRWQKSKKAPRWEY